MSIKLFTFNQNDKTYTVEKGAHLYEHRNNEKFHRDEFMDLERYKAVIHLAMTNGLTSFRKNNAVISFYDYNKRPFSMLVNLNEHNCIFIISVYKGRRGNSIQNGFIKVHNRINLVDYILPYMAPEKRKKQIQEKREFQTEVSCQKEDEIFLRAMRRK